MPTLTEVGYPNADVPIQFTIQAPAAVPTDIVGALSRKILEIARTPEMIARMRAINVVVPPLTPEQVAAAQDQEIEIVPQADRRSEGDAGLIIRLGKQDCC